MAPTKTFNDLPTEIRLQIWRAAVFPRLVTFVLAAKTRDHDWWGRWRWTQQAPTPPPAVLHVNREARAEVLPRYQLISIPQETIHPGPPGPLRPGMLFAADDSAVVQAYFCREVDTLGLATECLGWPWPWTEWFLQYLWPRHVYLDRSLWTDPQLVRVIADVRSFESVRTVTIESTTTWGDSVSPLFRFVTHAAGKDDQLRRTAVAYPPPNAAVPVPPPVLPPQGVQSPHAGRRGDNNFVLRTLSGHGRWTFAPAAAVREKLAREGAVVFEDEEPRAPDEHAPMLLVVDPATFPDELIFGLAARSMMHWRGDVLCPRGDLARVESRGTVKDWCDNAFRHLDGICLPSFGLDNDDGSSAVPPYAAPPWDDERGVDAAVAATAEIARSDLRVPFIAPVFARHAPNPTWQMADRKVWFDALTWREVVREHHGEDESFRHELSPESRRQIEGVLGGLVRGGRVWEEWESSAPGARPEPAPNQPSSLNPLRWLAGPVRRWSWGSSPRRSGV